MEWDGWMIGMMDDLMDCGGNEKQTDFREERKKDDERTRRGRKKEHSLSLSVSVCLSLSVCLSVS